MANIETLLVQWLNTDPALRDYPASMDVPADRPQRLITVERTGGDDGLTGGHPMVAIQVWGVSRYECSQTAGLVRRRLLAMPADPLLDAVTGVTIQSTVNFPLGDIPRYQILITVDMKNDGR